MHQLKYEDRLAVDVIGQIDKVYTSGKSEGLMRGLPGHQHHKLLCCWIRKGA
jgi:hypothetical protein